jgi:hypothetical protein
VGHCGWRVGVRVGVRVDLEEVLANEVWEVWVTNPLTKTMQAVWIFPSYLDVISIAIKKKSQTHRGFG